LLASIRRACFPHLGVRPLWIVRTRSWVFFLGLPQSASDGHTFWVIPKTAKLITVTRSIVRVNLYWPPTVVEELSLAACRVSQGLRLFRTIVAGPGGLRNFNKAFLDDCHFLRVRSKFSMLLVGPRSIGSVVCDFLSTMMEKFSRSVIHKYMSISKVRTIFSRANCSRDLV
jgi:hypothetical protein